MKQSWLLCLALVSLPVMAKVGPNQAEQLRSRLTPLGAERAANAEGSIPEWRGGLTAPPPCHAKGARYCDPYAEDQPYATITGENLEEWLDHLSAGQIELLKQQEDYRVEVYPTRRSFANPGAVYEAAYKNATKAVLSPSGESVRDASVAVPFPITKDGLEMIWNHQLRYRGPGFARSFSQASVTASGQASLIRMREEADLPYARGEVAPGQSAMHWLQWAVAPERLHGALTLVHQAQEGDATPLVAWQQTADSRSIRQARSYGYDNAALLSDDLRFDDQLDTYSGSPDRYTWRLVDKREIVVPYNSYALHSGRKGLREILRPGHLDPRLTRYELHRVWVIEANLKPQSAHRAKRRTFYLDEDSWQVLMVDLYDRNDQLWRWQEAHTIMAYDRGVLMTAVEAVYDLPTSRYLVQGIDEGDPERHEAAFEDGHFGSGNVRRYVDDN